MVNHHATKEVSKWRVTKEHSGHTRLRSYTVYQHKRLTFVVPRVSIFVGAASRLASGSPPQQGWFVG